jgi:transposase
LVWRSASVTLVGARRVLTDAMWAELEPLLPDRTPQRGGRWRDHREVVEAIIWRFRAGASWRDLPADFPPFTTVWERFDVWSKNGIWDEVLRQLQGRAHAVGELEWTVSVDSTVARAHQHAAGARRASIDEQPGDVTPHEGSEGAGSDTGTDTGTDEQVTGGWIESQESVARTC